MKTVASILVLVGLSLFTSAAELKPITQSDNLLTSVVEAQDEIYIKEQIQKLAKSQVPHAEDAQSLALEAFQKMPGLDARENWRTTGLFRAGRDVKDFAKEGDLVWEVRISRSGSGVSGIIWVSTTTKKAKVLFPTEP